MGELVRPAESAAVRARPKSKPPTVEDLFSDAVGRVAANLRRLRGVAGLSQEAVAERTGHAVRHVQRVEAGHVNPSLRLLMLLAAAVEADVADLLAPLPEDTARRTARGAAKRTARKRRKSPT